MKTIATIVLSIMLSINAWCSFKTATERDSKKLKTIDILFGIAFVVCIVMIIFWGGTA